MEFTLKYPTMMKDINKQILNGGYVGKFLRILDKYKRSIMKAPNVGISYSKFELVFGIMRPPLNIKV